MKRINISVLFPMLTLLLLIYALSTQLFNIPPLGKLLDPFVGAIQNEQEDGLSSPHFDIQKLRLKDSASVFFDDRKVPHIYAKNQEDLYAVQGYVTAYLRLWQMDFLSYVSAGRLSEIFSFPRVLDYDRNQRRMGILQAAHTSLDFIEKDPETNTVLSAYTHGVNAFIDQLDYKSMPFEYKLLNYSPEPWTNLKSVLIMKHMGNTLSGFEDDANLSKMMLTLGEEKFNTFFPDYHAHISPIVDDSAASENKALSHIEKPSYLEKTFISSHEVITNSDYNPKLGSNSWAVSGKKTKSGHPILCSDPHLNLSLPAVWIEMQLTSPGVNVYGVSIPGTPAIIIGFNEQIAWGITNGADDVKDWYKLNISSDYKKYEFDDKWKDLESEIVEIKRKNQLPFYDTLYHTLHGPIVINKSFQGQHPELNDYALKWELHNPSNEFLTFIKLNKSRNYEEFKAAINHYHCPIQNFTFAGKDNTIAIHHQGNMAIKWPGQGKFILDGTTSKHLSTEYIPTDSLPQLLNPVCNYVFSANQHPTSTNYGYYYNGYYSETRANRIKQLLEKENDFDIEKMKAMQLDNANALAVEALPLLVKSINEKKLNETQKQLLVGLTNWNGRYELGDEQAELFELWWRNSRDLTWDEFRKLSFHIRPPEDYLLLDFIRKDPTNDCFDKQGTTGKETAQEIVQEAFLIATKEYERLQKEHGKKWGDFNKVNVFHMTNMEAFSRMNMPSAGYPEAINAMSNGWGPSWRMIVELGDRPKAYGIYGGGQSGTIGSPYYDNFINDWNKGNYYPLQFFMSKQEASAYASNTWTLK